MLTQEHDVSASSYLHYHMQIVSVIQLVDIIHFHTFALSNFQP